MESFEFLFWLAVFLFVILRQVMGKKPPPEESERVGGPERAEGTTRADTPAPDALGGMRERLLEAAREWEAEQRRRTGLPERPGQAEAESTAATLDRPAAEPGRRGASRPARPSPREGRPRGSQAPSERRPGGLRAEPGRPVPGRPGPGRPDPGRRMDAPRRRPQPSTEWRDVSLPAPRADAEMAEPTPRPRPTRVEPRDLATPAPQRAAPGAPRSARVAPAGAAGAASPQGARKPAPLESLERYEPLKRAIVLAEILGRPRALDEPDGPPLT